MPLKHPENETVEEAFAKAQIARRMGIGFVVITALLGILFLADNQFLGQGDGAVLAPPAEPVVNNRTIRTPENRENPAQAAGGISGTTPEAPETSPASPGVGGQVTPIASVVPSEPPVPEGGQSPAAPTRRQVNHEGQGDTRVRAPGAVAKPKPTPGIVQTAPLRSGSEPAVEKLQAPPVQVTVESRKTMEPPVVGTPRLTAQGYVVQAGVFSQPQKAEELHALLTLNGIPSTLETRVHVGPFASKAQAEEARGKLKRLGVESLLLPPRR